MNNKTPYDVIGVSSTASLTEVRNAYTRRAKVLDPDRFDKRTQETEWLMATEMLQELNQAYESIRTQQSPLRFSKDIAAKNTAESSITAHPSDQSTLHICPNFSAKNRIPNTNQDFRCGKCKTILRQAAAWYFLKGAAQDTRDLVVVMNSGNVERPRAGFMGRPPLPIQQTPFDDWHLRRSARRHRPTSGYSYRDLTN